jgi:protein ImuB
MGDVADPIAQSGPHRPCYACVRLPPVSTSSPTATKTLLEIVQAFTPRYERHRADLVTMDVTGLERLMQFTAARGALPTASAARGAEGSAWQTLGEELVRALTRQELCAHVAVAGTRAAALVLAYARPGLTVIDHGDEAAALAPVPVDVLIPLAGYLAPARASKARDRGHEPAAVAVFKQWALRTLGELAALPAPDLMARLGQQTPVWQAIARGEDIRPLVPTEPEECFDASLELEWPIEGLEPLSFVLTRLLEPLSTRLERRDRGAAVLHVMLELVTRDVHVRHLQLPSPLRDVRTLRTLALLDIESHPPDAAVDGVQVVIDPTPGRVWQHTLFTRACPTPERLSTLLARLGAVMGHDRIGAPALLDTHRPGAFVMHPFATDPAPVTGNPSRTERPGIVESALRRCRQPVPARVVVDAGRPVRVSTDRRGFTGGTVLESTGPWRTSGHWWAVDETAPSAAAWDRDEWDVALSDGALYRVFHDRVSDAWFIEGMFD